MSTFLLGEGNLSLADVEAIARGKRKVSLSKKQFLKLHKNRNWLVQFLKRTVKPIYGINTGFGALANVKIEESKLRELQINLLRSHACGIGEYFSKEEIRAILLLRAHSLALGFSGVRPELVQILVHFLTENIHPLVPQKGSVGASGDLIPLAHIGLTLMGEGKVVYNGKEISSRKALEESGQTAYAFEFKEGISLINGTQAMTGVGALSLRSAERALQSADIIAAFSLEAIRASHTPFDASLQKVRPFLGQRISAENIRHLIDGSPLNLSHAGCAKIQDSYSFRCIPQVHGAAYDALSFAYRQVTIEANSVTDNPIIFPEEDKVVSGGNFHGEPVAMALDFAAVALAEIGSISERRLAQLLDPHFSNLPPFLASNPGLESGLMMAQVAAASLVSESKILAYPASIDSIPTSLNQEDHVSMGMGAALKFSNVLKNTEHVLALELLASLRALAILAPLKPAAPLERLAASLGKSIKLSLSDQPLTEEIKKLRQLIQEGKLLKIEETVGKLKGVSDGLP